MATEFVPGDVVHLKSSDGPEMTIEAVSNEQGIPQVTCVWFEKNQARRMQFRAVVLAASESMHACCGGVELRRPSRFI